MELNLKSSTGNFSGLLIKFSLRRQNGYHVLQTYVPTILIVSISWVSFWLDPNAVPGRVSLGVTTLLTLTTLASGTRASLPPVSYVKVIQFSEPGPFWNDGYNPRICLHSESRQHFIFFVMVGLLGETASYI